jgi:phosphoglycerate kinase
MAYTFLCAKGVAVGQSLVEQDFIPLAAELIDEARTCNVDLALPVDHLASPGREDTSHIIECTGSIPKGLMGLDIGPETTEIFCQRLEKAKTVLWNGPLGLFETEAFSQGTMAVARRLAATGATTIIAGGDTVAAVDKAGVAANMTHLSTGGGATLELLEGKTLPGVAALEDADHGSA